MALPDLPTLESRLRATLDPELVAGRVLRVLDRTAPPRAGKRFSAEFVDLRIGDERLTLFAKHGPAVDGDDPFMGGMPGGLAYEALAHGVARTVDPVSTPTAYGLHVSPDGDATLFFERIIERPAGPADPQVPVDLYAAWLGRFQRKASHAAHLSDARLFTIDAAFLVQWLDRARTTMRSLGFEAPASLGKAYADDIGHLVVGDAVLLHGDFYSDNVLKVADDTLRIIDWELAALGPGEIDLASLVQGRSERVARACIDAYAHERYGGAVPRSFERRLLAARTHVLLRVLSIVPPPERVDRYRKRLRLLSELLEQDR
jgi:hypothetical protein